VDERLQHRLLVWGVAGALVMRGAMIALGAELIVHFRGCCTRWQRSSSMQARGCSSLTKEIFTRSKAEFSASPAGISE